MALARLELGSCAMLSSEVEEVCGLVVEDAGGCVCWINMPTFKSNSLFIRTMSKLAAMVKMPSRVTTFLEMTLSSDRNGSLHVAPLRKFEGESFALSTCDLGEEDCSATFSFTRQSKLRLFRGAPATVAGVLSALSAM
jgi:hypothetical protein